MYKGLNSNGSIFKVTILDSEGLAPLNKLTGKRIVDENGNPKETFLTKPAHSKCVVAGTSSIDGKIFHLVFKPADKVAVDAEAATKGLYAVEGQSLASTDGQYVIQMYKPIKTFDY